MRPLSSVLHTEWPQEAQLALGFLLLAGRSGMVSEGTSFEYKGPNAYCKVYSKYLKGSSPGVSGVEEVVKRGVEGTVKTTVNWPDSTTQFTQYMLFGYAIYILS